MKELLRTRLNRLLTSREQVARQIASLETQLAQGRANLHAHNGAIEELTEILGTLTPALSQGEREPETLTPALSQGEREPETLTSPLSQGEREKATVPFKK